MNKQSVLALDIGADCIKAFLADVQPRSLHIQSHGRVDSIKLDKGELLNPGLLSEKLKQAVACTLPDGLSGVDSVVVGLSGIDLGTQVTVGTVNVKGDYITVEDLLYAKRAAELTAVPDTAELLHTTQIRYRIEGQLVRGTPIGQRAPALECECVVWVVSKEILQRIREALALAKLQPNYLVANIFALYKTTHLEADSYLVLDIGAGSVDFVMCGSGRVITAGVLPLGGDIITKAIEGECGLDFFHAEKLKRYFIKLAPELYGQGIMLDCSYENEAEKNIAFDFLSDIIHNRMSAVSELIGKVLKKDLNDNKIASAYVVGGCVTTGLFLDSLSNELGASVKELDLQKIPAPYRGPENAAGYALLQYVQLCLAEQQQAEQQRPSKGETEATSSFVTKIKNMLRL